MLFTQFAMKDKSMKPASNIEAGVFLCFFYGFIIDCRV